MRASLLSRIAGAVVVAVPVACLWVVRPGLPSLPESPTQPVSVEQLEEILAFCGWLALLVATMFAIGQRGRSRARPTPHTQHAAAHPRRRRRRGHAPAPASFTVAVSPGRDAAEKTRVGDEMQAHIEHGSQSGARLRVRVLGPPVIESAEGDVRPARSSTQEMLTYLALHPRGGKRDELTEAIWPGEDPRRTRQRLWQSTSEARKLMGDALISDRGHYSLDRAKVSVDADDLDALRVAANGAATPADERRVLERGLGLLRGDPLAGWDRLWADTHAGRLRAIQVELLERLGRARLLAADAQGALEAAELGLSRDPLNEALWRLAMEAEAGLGLRAAVNQRYERLQTQLDQQLGLEPETETRALLRGLLGQR